MISNACAMRSKSRRSADTAFGLIAGVVASYKGLHPGAGPKGVGEAVNQTVVITFLLLFFANLILTMVYLQIVPAKGS